MTNLTKRHASFQKTWLRRSRALNGHMICCGHNELAMQICRWRGGIMGMADKLSPTADKHFTAGVYCRCNFANNWVYFKLSNVKDHPPMTIKLTSNNQLLNTFTSYYKASIKEGQSYSHRTVVADIIVVRLVPGTTSHAPGQSTSHFMRSRPHHLRVMAHHAQFVVWRSVSKVLPLCKPHAHRK